MEFANPVQHTDTQTNPESYLADRFVVNDYPTMTPGCVTHMQEDLAWGRLQNRRLDSRFSMLYKIDHHLVDVKKETYLQSGDNRTRGGHTF